MLPALTSEEIAAIRDALLSMDALVRKCIHDRFSFRCVPVLDYRAAMAIETAVKNGALGQAPRLNPPRPS